MTLSEVIQDVRRVLETEGVDGLRVDDLTKAVLSSLSWSGSPMHLVSVGRAFDRIDTGEVEYLVARGPNGDPVAKAGIDYAASPGAGTLMQLATADELQGLGIATHLIGVAEGRIRARGLRAAELGVEANNPGARACGVRKLDFRCKAPIPKGRTEFAYPTGPVCGRAARRW